MFQKKTIFNESFNSRMPGGDKRSYVLILDRNVGLINVNQN